MITPLPCAARGIALSLVIAAALPAPATAQSAEPPTEAIRQAESLSAAFRHAASIIRPSVVQIRPAQVIERVVTDPRFDPFGLGVGPRQRQQLRREGLGSGVVISTDGYILTNNHVIDGADSLAVVFADETEAPAVLIGADPATDLAVVRVDPRTISTTLVPATLGDSDAMQVGDWVIAVGSPLALEQTVTAGIVSATGRRQNIIRGGYEDFIQTDAAINPGNSGGPLANLAGEVVGINTAIKSTSGGNIGIGFATPTSIARDVADQLIASGRVQRGFLGVGLADLDPAEAVMLGLPDTTRGALVTSVSAGTPADRSGIQVNDVITAINSLPIRDQSDAQLRIAQIRPGEPAVIDLFRAGGPVRVSTVVADQSLILLEPLGLSLTPVDESTARARGVRELPDGSLVVQVDPDSPAERAGFVPGDIILALGNLRTPEPRALASLLERADPGRRIPFTVLTESGEVETKVLRLPDGRGR